MKTKPVYFDIWSAKKILPILIGVTILWVISIVLYKIMPMPENVHGVIEFFFMTISGLGVFLSAIFMVWSSLETNSNIRDNRIFNKIVNSFKFATRWEEPDIKKARKMTRKIGTEQFKISPNELLKMIDEDENGLQDYVVVIANFFEQMYLEIVHGTVDEAALRNTFRLVFFDIFERFSPWFNKNPKETMKDLDKLKKRWE